MDIFIEISVILLFSMLISLLMRILRQPLIIGYILTGIILGPYLLNIIQTKETIELFAKFGITMLLFIVGLNLNPQVIREVGKVSFLAGISQVVVTSIVGFFIARFLGIEKVAALYVGIGLTFSSTIIILKLLSDKGDLNKLYGKIAIGFLIVQDIIATIILLITSSTANSGGASIILFTLYTVMKGAFLISIIVFISVVILPKIEKIIASSQEFLFLFSLTWGLGLATLFYALGFSVEIGALVAGVTMSMTPYSVEVSSRLRPLRDFFIVLFFIFLGSQMVLDNFLSLIIPATVLSAYVLIGNPIIMIIVMSLLGYGKRTSFLTGLTVAQISEFSLILASVGFQIGQISREILSLITLVGIITITASTYFILYSDHLYPKVEKFLTLLQLKRKKNEKGFEEEYEAVLFGYQRVGEDFVKAFEKLGLEFIVVDFNPESVEYMKKEKIPHKYGDAKDAEFLSSLKLKDLRYVVSTIPEHETNVLLLKKIREYNKHAIILVVSQNRDEADMLYKSGASYVIMPHYLGAQYATKIIREYGVDRRQYTELKQKHLKYLQTREV